MTSDDAAGAPTDSETDERALPDFRPQPPRVVVERARALAHRALFKDAALARSRTDPLASTLGGERQDERPGPPNAPPLSVRRGGVLGRYLVLGTLGRGGMGTVVKAYDESLDRTVAIKLLHSGTTERHAQRLQREAQALAKLSHPNVVHVYEVGLAARQWFIAMELVPGTTLYDWQAQQHDWQESVRVYLQAGAGLRAAHVAGLVHRDFKPDNCIIDEQGRVRVLDFGLVRDTVRPSEEVSEPDAHTDDAIEGSLTRTGAVLGTVAYMPPEQLKGARADARSDQFSFCVSLYEAVYGERPFEGKSMAALLVSMDAGEVRPSPGKSTVPGALRKVLLRGLAAQPDARWPSMDALLDELRRLVAPRRRRWVALGLAAGLAALGGGVAFGQYAQVMNRCTGAGVQLEEIWDDSRRQELRAALMDTGVSYAPDTWTRVEQRLDDYTARWTAAHTKICEATRVTQEQSEEEMSLRMGCMHDRKVALRAAVDVLARADAKIVANAVNLVAGLPRLAGCDDLKALQARVPPPEDPRVAREVEVLRERIILLEAERKAGKYASALEGMESVLRQAEELEYGPLVADAKAKQGWLRLKNGRYAEAERDLLDAYELGMTYQTDEAILDAVEGLITVVGHEQARHDEGLVWGRVALAHIKRRGEGTALVHEASILTDVGLVLEDQGKISDALDHHQRALDLWIRALGEHHQYVALALDSIGVALAKQGKPDEALSRFQKALAIAEEALGEHHPYVAILLEHIGHISSMQGRSEEALGYYQRALVIHEQTVGEHHRSFAISLHNIGGVLHAQDKLDEALDYYRRALAVQERALGEEHPDVASSLANIGLILREREQLDEARAHHQRSLDIKLKVLGKDHPELVFSLLELARVAEAQHDLATARTHAERALVICEASEVSPSQLASARFVLARALWSDPTERERARALAEQARETLAAASVGQSQSTLAAVQTWLNEHET